MAGNGDPLFVIVEAPCCHDSKSGAGVGGLALRSFIVVWDAADVSHLFDDVVVD